MGSKQALKHPKRGVKSLHLTAPTRGAGRAPRKPGPATRSFTICLPPVPGHRNSPKTRIRAYLLRFQYQLINYIWVYLGPFWWTSPRGAGERSSNCRPPVRDEHRPSPVSSKNLTMAESTHGTSTLSKSWSQKSTPSIDFEHKKREQATPPESQVLHSSENIACFA